MHDPLNYGKSCRTYQDTHVRYSHPIVDNISEFPSSRIGTSQGDYALSLCEEMARICTLANLFCFREHLVLSRKVGGVVWYAEKAVISISKPLQENRTGKMQQRRVSADEIRQKILSLILSLAIFCE